jgi:hypothetical protein
LADKFFGAAKGAQIPLHVTESGSTTSLAVELRISDTIYSDPLAVQMALEAIKNYLRTKETNPIA